MYNVLLATATTTPVPMSNILTTAGEVVSQSLSWVGDVANTVAGTPIIFLTVGVMLLGAAIGIFGRLLSRN